MAQNIERVLERGDRIDLLVDKTNNLSTEAFAFRKRSTALKRRLWWRNQRLVVLLVCSLIISAYVAISSVCGFPGWGRCRAP
ncbi:Vesicle-associated membrane protein 714 [Smittium mucronatum]|uniref:Vesicle-associated membrane protein 714 n=1 Tax=Smittium mucronatum TaxID=133383 RepID=A0A1R0GLZ8_9FUNG|nr:Vesicle-associated membrane protein 714 [Smittium mucronatum]